MDNEILDGIIALVVVGLCIGIFFIVNGIWTIHLYGGKNVECIEDKGASFNATISSDLFDTVLFFEYGDGKLRFKGTDGTTYMCRGIAKISEVI